MAQSAMEQFHVLVIGAGSTGLLVAQGLKQAGISFEIFEKSDDETYRHRQRNWTMALHWGSDYLKACLPPDLRANIRSTETDPTVELTEDQETQIPIVNGKTGETLVKIPSPTSRRVAREKFRKFVMQGLDIRYGSKAVDIQDDGRMVTVRFENGCIATGHALIGCDSANSFVRSYLLGAERAQCENYPVIAYNFTCSHTTEQALKIWNFGHPLVKLSAHPDQNTFYMMAMVERKDPKDPSTWVFQHFLNIWGGDGLETPPTPAERLKHYKEVAANYCEPFKSAAHSIPDDTDISFDLIKHWPKICRWDNHGGRITLAGDAAHPMLPFRGQGMNNGLEDAAHYVDALKKVLSQPGSQSADFDVAFKEIIDEYDSEVVARGGKEIALSSEQAYRSMHFDEFMSSPMAKHGMNKVKD